MRLLLRWISGEMFSRRRDRVTVVIHGRRRRRAWNRLIPQTRFCRNRRNVKLAAVQIVNFRRPVPDQARHPVLHRLNDVNETPLRRHRGQEVVLNPEDLSDAREPRGHNRQTRGDRPASTRDRANAARVASARRHLKFPPLWVVQVLRRPALPRDRANAARGVNARRRLRRHLLLVHLLHHPDSPAECVNAARAANDRRRSKVRPLEVRLLRRLALPAERAVDERHSSLRQRPLLLPRHLNLRRDRGGVAVGKAVLQPGLHQTPVVHLRAQALMAKQVHRPHRLREPLLNRPAVAARPNGVAVATASTDGR